MTRPVITEQPRRSSRHLQVFRDLRNHNERRARIVELQRERRLDRERTDQNR